MQKKTIRRAKSHLRKKTTVCKMFLEIKKKVPNGNNDLLEQLKTMLKKIRQIHMPPLNKKKSQRCQKNCVRKKNQNNQQRINLKN